MDAIELLNHLAEYQSQRQLLQLEKQKLIDAVITPEIKAQLAEIDAEFGDKFAGVDDYINSLTEKVKDAVINEGATIKGAYLQAVYSKGRVSWDTKGLDGYIVAHPELEQFRKTGDPSVSIRAVK